MSFIGQPADYSEMLKRIFWSSVATSIGCILLIANASQPITDFLDSIPIKVDYGQLKDIQVLYVFIPFLIALFSRQIKLHDKISSIFRIRYRFDTLNILFPMAKGVGFALTDEVRRKIQIHRIRLMYNVFYPYAGFNKPKIDEQLVRTAADNWGWLWSLVESSFLLIVTATILGYMKRWDLVMWIIIVVFVWLLFMLYHWVGCKKGGQRQVDAILADPDRKSSILSHFQDL